LAGALRSNTTGIGNTAIGASALFENTTGTNNTASGVNALLNNTAPLSGAVQPGVLGERHTIATDSVGISSRPQSPEGGARLCGFASRPYTVGPGGSRA